MVKSFTDARFASDLASNGGISADVQSLFVELIEAMMADKEKVISSSQKEFQRLLNY